MAQRIVGLASGAHPRSSITVVCVGTDRSTGDSLGPLVGTMLRERRFPGKVIGTLESPVHAENLSWVASRIRNENSFVLGVDACLGTKDEVGAIMVKSGPLKPGLGVRKNLSPIGDGYVAGVVNVGGFMEYMVLQNTRLSVVMKMARIIALGIEQADRLMLSPHYAEEGAQDLVSAIPTPQGRN